MATKTVKIPQDVLNQVDAFCKNPVEYLAKKHRRVTMSFGFSRYGDWYELRPADKTMAYISAAGGNHLMQDGSHIIFAPRRTMSWSQLTQIGGKNDFCFPAAWLCDKAMWVGDVTMRAVTSSGTTMGRNMQYSIVGVSVENLKMANRLEAPLIAFCDSAHSSIETQFMDDFPYDVQTQQLNDLPAYLFYVAPQIGQLYKAGYAKLVDDFVWALYHARPTDVVAFFRLTQPGNNMQEIFKTTSGVYKTLKGEKVSIKVWDTCRRLVKTGKVRDDTISLIVDMGLDERELASAYQVLGFERNGKKILTLDKLVALLRRLDMYEALGTEQALMYVRDYLLLCREMDIEPNLESDSIIREHNVTARLSRDIRNPKYVEQMFAAGRMLQTFDYAGEQFFVRGVRDQNDLIDEAKQQRNCIACYARQISENKSLIFFMRKRSDPGKSLVTVELSPDGRTIRQKLRACNQPIRDAEISDFLKEWSAWLKKQGDRREIWKEICNKVVKEIRGFSPETIYAAECAAFDRFMETDSMDEAVKSAWEYVGVSA